MVRPARTRNEPATLKDYPLETFLNSTHPVTFAGGKLFVTTYSGGDGAGTVFEVLP